MAKTTAPLLSMGASGTIGKTLVHASWKGRKYARQHVVPANPNTSAQQAVRGVFSWLNLVYRQAPTIFTDIWTLYAKGQVLTARNGLIKQNVPMLSGASDLSDFVFSPGAKGGPPVASITATGGSGEVTVAATMPTPPTGWTAAGVLGFAIKAQDPHSGTAYAIYGGEDDTSPYSIVLTVPAGDYEVSAVAKWTKPDGSTAYGPGVNSTATAT